MKKSLAFFLINFLIFLFFLEIILQLFYKLTVGDYLINRANIPIYATDENCCWKLKKNLSITHKTNEFNYKIYTNGSSFSS